MCTCSALFWLKAFSQRVQSLNRGPAAWSPVWMRLCRSSWLGLAKAFSQLKEGPRRAATLAGGRRGRTLRCVARLKAFLHTGQTWMRSRPGSSLLWCSSRAAEAKVRPHSRHWCSRPSFSGCPPWARLGDTPVTWSGSEIPA
uniref:Secreted protein n=1 Tax=Balaenoptera musculus TaxID=9771 RepID=A0A8C0CX56_BALMU